MTVQHSEILEGLKRAIMEYDSERAVSLAQRSIEEGLDPTIALGAMTTAIRQVGDAFESGEVFLPSLFGAAEAMSSALPILEEEVERKGVDRATLGTVVIGTVRGDIHSIGKGMVAAMLVAEGFEVRDIGVDRNAKQFLDAVREYDADILAMSALMTTTAAEQRRVVDSLREEGLRDQVRIMVGGGAVTEGFAKEIGADGYDPTAPGAAKLARRLMEGMDAIPR
jgi:corrinoid protein of di/trimethylamine methyltransferase